MILHFLIRLSLLLLLPALVQANTLLGSSVKGSLYSLSGNSPYNKLTCSVKNPRKLIDLHIHNLKKKIPDEVKKRLRNTEYTFSVSSKKACTLSTSDKFADPAVQKGIQLMENLILTTVCVYFDYLYVNSWVGDKTSFRATKNPDWYYGVGSIRNAPFDAWIHKSLQHLQFQTKTFPVSKVKYQKLKGGQKYILSHASNKKPKTNLMATVTNIKYKFQKKAYLPQTFDISVGKAYGETATLASNCIAGNE